MCPKSHDAMIPPPAGLRPSVGRGWPWGGGGEAGARHFGGAEERGRRRCHMVWVTARASLCPLGRQAPAFIGA